MKLYELTDMYNNLLNMLQDPDSDSEAIKDTLEALEGDISEKAGNIAKLLRNFEGDIETLKQEEKRLLTKRKAIETNKDKLKAYLQSQLEQIHINKVKTPLFTVSIQNNPPSVNILQDELIPESYLIVPSPQIDRKTILSDLKQGKKIPGAELKQSKSLRIR